MESFIAYHKIAEYYDEFQNAEDTAQIVEQIKKAVNLYAPQQNHLQMTDLGCGTGEYAIPLCRAGFQIEAVDISKEMLHVLADKIELLKPQEQQRIRLHLQDLTMFQTDLEQDLIICMTDTLNHLERTELDLFFTRLPENLKEQGLFIFDLLRLDYLMEERGNQTIFAEFGADTEAPEMSFVWENQWIPEEQTAISNFTFFEKDQSGRYRRSIDQTIEYYYSAEQIAQLLPERFILRQKIEYPERILFVYQQNI